MTAATFTAIFTTAGTFTWVAPAGVTSVKAECWGGGGGSAGIVSGTHKAGAGGGGEYAAEPSLAVVAGNAYTVTVGAAGTGGTNAGTVGNAGGASTFPGNAVTVTANPGQGGSNTGATTPGGPGGTGSTNTVHNNGGAGGSSSQSTWGGPGGGGSGGSSAAGNAGTDASTSAGAAGATAVTGGGPGGNGGAESPQAAGSSPVSGPGGGGGSPGGGGGGGAFAGSAGWAGQVKITWTMNTPAKIAANTAGGVYSWTVPTGVTHVDAAASGSGAGGFQTGTNGGAGGGGGEYAEEASLAVTPGNSYVFVVGEGGASNAGGASSTVTGDSVTVTAHGGAVASADTTGGLGGTGSPNTIHNNGGQGGHDGTTGGGGGGGSGGTSAAGNAGSSGSTTTGGAGATAVTGGGPGGAGGNATVAGSAPISGPGGGGGGAGYTSVVNGAGYDGQIVLTFSRTSTGSIAAPRMAFSGTAKRGPGVTGSIALRRMAFSGADTVGVLSTGSIALPRMGTSGQLLGPPFPSVILGIEIDILLNGVWTDITDYIYQRSDTVIIRGRPNEGQQGTSNPSQMTFILDNRDSRFNPKNPASLYYPYLTRNTQARIYISAVSATMDLYQGYRFWGEISEWPPSWDPTGSDVYIQVVAAGILRRLSQQGPLRSSMSRYYSMLSNPPLAWWACEDGSTAASLLPGLPNGQPMNFAGPAQLASDNSFVGSAPAPVMNGAIFTGLTGAGGSLPAVGQEIFSAASSGHWVAPANVTQVIVECWGAGGGGAASGGGGGGGGEYAAETVLAVTPGNSYAWSVGAAGTINNNGASTSFAGDSVTVTAHGGSKGSGTSGGVGGAGSLNGVHHNGGAGGPGSAGSGGTQSSQTFNTDGTWNSPSDLYGGTVAAEVWAAGGGGGGGGSSQGGGGAGSGGLSSDSVAVTPSTGYAVSVGGAGFAGLVGFPGTKGGDSSFAGDSATVTATGGYPGYANGNGQSGGSGDLRNGSDGGSSSKAHGAGGAGSPGMTGSGGNGKSGGSGGAGGGGGSGGGASGGDGGSYSSKNGKSGGTPGAGGGGGYWNSAGSGGNGGNGANGRVKLYWYHGGSPATGGGGGSSGGTASAGNAGSSEARGAAVIGGGPGGGVLAGGVWTAAPEAGPGGGGGGNDVAGGAAAGWDGQIRITYAATGGGSSGIAANVLRFLLHIPGSGEVDGAVVARMFTAGTIAYTDVVYNTVQQIVLGATGVAATNPNPNTVLQTVQGGTVTGISVNGISTGLTSGTFSVPGSGTITVTYSVAPTTFTTAGIPGTTGFLTLNAYSAAGALLFTSGLLVFSADGIEILVSVELRTSGSNVHWQFTGLKQGLTAGTTISPATASGTYSSATLGDPYEIVFNPSGVLTQTSFCQCTIEEIYTSISNLAMPVAANAGETAAARFSRLCSEEGISFSLAGTASDTEIVGPQAIDKLVNILQSAEDADRGLLFEPRDFFGLKYRTRTNLYNQSPAIVLNYTDGDLAQDLQPTADDQLTRNDVIVTRLNGSSYEAVDTTGPLSNQDPPNGVGPYVYPLTANVAFDSQVPDLASWILHVGTVDELRYPQVNLDMARSQVAPFFSDIGNADIGDYEQIQNPPAWLPPYAIDQLIFGYTETINAFKWAFIHNCVPESPYEIAIAFNSNPLLPFMPVTWPGITFANNGDGGTNGATVTAGSGGNSGGASGNYWNTVKIGTGASLIFDGSIFAGNSGLSYHATSGATAAQVNAVLSGVGNVAKLWQRADFFFESFPANTHRVMGSANSSAFICGAIRVNSSGHVEAIDSTSTVRATSINTIPLNQWFRIECEIDGSATAGQIIVRIFTDIYDTIPLEIFQTASTINTRGTQDQARYGEESGAGVANINFWVDDAACSATGWIGPAWALSGSGSNFDTRADTDGSSLHQGIGIGDASFSVDTPSPYQPWIDGLNYATEFPFDITVGGEQMTVTDVSGTSSPQIFTVIRSVNGVIAAHSAGDTLSLTYPSYIPL